MHLIRDEALADNSTGDDPVEIRQEKLVWQGHELDEGVDVELAQEAAVLAAVEVVEQRQDRRPAVSVLTFFLRHPRCGEIAQYAC